MHTHMHTHTHAHIFWIAKYLRPKQINRKPKPHLPSFQGESNLISTQYTRTHLEYLDLCLSRSCITCMLDATSITSYMHVE